MDPLNVPDKFEVRNFTRSRDNSDWSFGWGLQTPNLGEEAEAVGMVPFERALICEFRPSIVTFPRSICTRFRDIAAFVLHL